MTDDAYRAVISGTRRGVSAACLRAGLAAAATCYGVGVRARNWAFDLKWKRVERAAIPVISLGNITAGGTGKTPFAAYVARWFRERGVRVCLLSRGYGAADGAMNDEALVLEQLCPDVPHLQNPDRVTAARVAVEELESQVLLLDDGFQHRRLARDLDIVLIDALNPWGYGHLLPRGLLREPLSSLVRANLIVITRVDQVSPEEVARIRERIIQDKPVVEVAFPAARLVNASGATAEFDSLRGSPVAAFCGIGHPEAFRATLAQLGFEVKAFRTFADHHPYSPKDLDELRQWLETANVVAAVVTQKDLVKIGVDRLGNVPLWAVEIGTHVVGGNDALERKLNEVLQRVVVA